MSLEDIVAKHVSDNDHYAVLCIPKKSFVKLKSTDLPPLFVNNTLCATACFAPSKAKIWTLADTLLTAQYSRPHVDLMTAWNVTGGIEYHPGEYDVDELLDELTKTHSAWMYWGHAETHYLRGYGHLHQARLETLQRTAPFALTMWLTCNTLRSLQENQLSIAASWYLNQQTDALLAATMPVNTAHNSVFSSALLDVLMEPITSKNSIDLRILLLNTLQQVDDEVRTHILQAYRLLGTPQIIIERE